jgi:hypothetical protein
MGSVVACFGPLDSLAAIKGSKFESYHVQKSNLLQHHQVSRRIQKSFPKRECTWRIGKILFFWGSGFCRLEVEGGGQFGADAGYDEP